MRTQKLNPKGRIKRTGDAKTGTGTETKKNKNRRPNSEVLILAACVILLFGNCSRFRNTHYASFKSPDGDTWNHLEVLGYYPSPADSSYLSHPFDVILTVRHTDRCNVASVPVVLTESDGTNRNNNDTIIIPLADAAGRWLGKGSYGIYTLEKTLHHNFRIPEGYEILIKPAFEKTEIKGITDIGISLTTPYI